MDNKPSKGDIQTVSGIISPDKLGATMTHEHLLIDFTCMFSEPEDARFVNLAYQPVDLIALTETLDFKTCLVSKRLMGLVNLQGGNWLREELSWIILN